MNCYSSKPGGFHTKRDWGEGGEDVSHSKQEPNHSSFEEIGGKFREIF